MPNPRNQTIPAVSVSPGTGSADSQMPVVEKAAWADANLPGPTQPRDRSMGVRKVKTTMKAEGL
jgi:hypothetical protein